MRIYSEKTFIFKNGEEIESIRNKEIKDVEDWVQETELFKLAKEDGDIEVIESIVQQKNIEKGDNKRNRNKGNTEVLDKREQNSIEESSTKDK